MKTQEMIEKRAALISDARSIIDAADAEGRELNTEQREKVDLMLNDSDLMQSDIEQRHRLDSHNEKLAKVEDRKTALAIDNSDNEDRETNPIRKEEYRNAFMTYLRGGKGALSHAEYRDLTEGTNTTGGYIAPMFAQGQANMQDMIIETMDAAQNFSPVATSINIEGQVTIPTETATGSAAWIAAEGDAYTESDPAFGQLTLTPYKAGTLTQISEELLQDSVVNLEQFVSKNIGRKFATLLETAFVNGSGSGQPTGVTDGSALGVTAVGTTAVTFDEVQDLFYSLKETYRKNGSWLMSTTAVAALRQLKYSSGTQAYIWEPSMSAGSPDTILGRPVVISDSCEAMTSGLKPILFGDMSYYYIAYNAGVSIQRLDELYAANGLVGIRGSLRVDGELTQSEAVKHLVLG
jgi:HK97 family phage major capsid protein